MPRRRGRGRGNEDVLGDLLSVLQRTGHWRRMLAAVDRGQEVTLDHLPGMGAPTARRDFNPTVGAGRPQPWSQPSQPCQVAEGGAGPLQWTAPGFQQQVQGPREEETVCSRCQRREEVGVRDICVQVSFEDILLDL